MVKSVSMKLSDYRSKRGLTQQDVADAIGLSKSRVCEIEQGSGCSLNTALAIERFTKGAVRPADVARPAAAVD